MATSRRLPRTTVELPWSVVTDLQRYTPNGPTLTTLCVHWIVLAARLAHLGFGDQLPPAGYGYSAVDMLHPVRPAWTGRELERCRAEIEAVGSSIPAVVRRAAESFVEARGNLVEMSWPDFPLGLVA